MPRFFSCFVAVSLILSALISPLSAASVSSECQGGSAPSVSGECAALYLPEKDLFLYEKQANKRHPMASTTKIMTALVAIEETSPHEEVVISPDAVGVEGSSVYLRAGERQTMENLLYALLLASANDAAAAIAIYVGGSIEGFATLMNEKAEALGLSDTHFMNPHGLADPNHYTTAADLARITAAAMENPLFAEIVGTKHKVIRVHDGESARSLSNHNRLLRSYEDCVGVKTGFTKLSGRCLVSAARRDGMLAIAVTLDAPNDWQDHTALLDYSFSCYRGQMPFGEVTPSVSLSVLGGLASYVTASAEKAPVFITPQNAPNISAVIEANRMATAPIKQGNILGQIRYFANGEEIASEPLYADFDVGALPAPHGIWDKIKNFFHL